MTDPAAATDFETVQEQFDEVYDQANPPISPDDELIDCLYAPTRLYADTISLVAAENEPDSNFSLDSFGLRRATTTRIDPELIAETGANLRMTELTLASTADDPVSLANQLSAFDIYAAPDYQMFATPRHYFPGSFPVPRTLETPLSYTAPDGEHNVYVLDTGIDADQGYAVDDVLVGGHQDVSPLGANEDDPLVLSTPLDYVGGHGAFVAGVLAQQAPGVGIQVRAVSPPTTAPNFYESDFINAAARARAQHDSDNETEPMLTNISLGVSNCDTFGGLVGAGEESLPVGTFRAVTEILLKNSNDMIVAASGNSGSDEQITYPAAFFNRPESAALELALLEDIETRTIAEFSDQTLAVGASDHGRIAEYSTFGDWVDVYAEGCHVADYPDGTFVYPPSPVDSTTESREFVSGVAEWCGSSFSTPLVAGMVADAWINGMTFAEAREDILARAVDVDGSLILDDFAFRAGVNQVTDPSATDAIDTANDTCQLLFPEPDSARSVLLARDNIFADSLTGSPLASDDSCILFTPTDTLDARTAAEIDRVLPDGGLVRILGGNAAVSDAIQTQLATRFTVERFGGVTRVQTATAIADAVLAANPDQDQAMIAYANDFPDAVTGGAYGAETGTPVLLSDTAELHPDTRLWLDANDIATGYLLGGTAVLGPEVESQVGITITGNEPVTGRVQRVAGPNRMGTAAAVATELWGSVISGSPENLVILDLERPDAWTVALSSAPLSALCDAPQLGVRAAGTPAETSAYLVAQDYPPIPTVLMMGPARDDGVIQAAIE